MSVSGSMKLNFQLLVFKENIVEWGCNIWKFVFVILSLDEVGGYLGFQHSDTTAA